jgi:hypothetical protein
MQPCSASELRRYLRHVSVLLADVEADRSVVHRVLILRCARHWATRALDGIGLLLRDAELTADATPTTITDQ